MGNLTAYARLIAQWVEFIVIQADVVHNKSLGIRTIILQVVSRSFPGKLFVGIISDIVCNVLFSILE